MECKMWERSLLMGLCCLVMVGCGGSPKEASAAGRLAEAKRLVESGDFETARPLLEDLSWSGRDGVDAPETLWLLGRCLETLGDRSQAETIYYRCVKLNGGKNRFSIQAFAGLARLASSSGRPSSSERFLRRALNSKGSTRQHDEIRLLMATAAFDAGRRVEARQLLKAITTPALPGRSALEVRVNNAAADIRIAPGRTASESEPDVNGEPDRSMFVDVPPASGDPIELLCITAARKWLRRHRCKVPQDAFVPISPPIKSLMGGQTSATILSSMLLVAFGRAVS